MFELKFRAPRSRDCEGRSFKLAEQPIKLVDSDLLLMTSLADIVIYPTLFWARHVYCPWSRLIALEICSAPDCKIRIRRDGVRRWPFRLQVILGFGIPCEEHFNITALPSTTWVSSGVSMNLGATVDKVWIKLKKIHEINQGTNSE